MDGGVRIVWWIGLVGALLLTLVILKQASLVLRALDDIQRLAERTREGARGIDRNVDAVSRLEGVGEPLGRVGVGVGALAEATSALERRVAGIGAAPGRWEA